MVEGWCYMTKENIAIELGLTKQGVLKMIERLIRQGFLIRNKASKFIKTTTKWQDVYYLPVVTNGKQSLPELVTDGKQSLPEVGKQSLPYNNTTDNNKHIHIEERKTKFYNNLLEFQKQNLEKYPDVLYTKFFSYWTELTQSQKQMRFEGEKYFEVPKRLATFWLRFDKEVKKDFYETLKNKSYGHIKSKQRQENSQEIFS